MSDENSLRLIVSRPGKFTRENEREEFHGDHETTESADAALAPLKGEWCEATLCVPSPTSAGWDVVMRRLPATGWRTVQRWAARPTHTDTNVDADAITAWLRAVGVRVGWPAVLAHQWPGHERGLIYGAGSPEQDRLFRCGAHRDEDALEYVVRAIVAEAQESGAMKQRVTHKCDAHDEQSDADFERFKAQNARIHALENEVRRLKGEPELVDPEASAENITKIEAYLLEFAARRNGKVST